MNTSAIVSASAGVGARATTRPAPSVTISRACAGPADAGDPVAAERSASQQHRSARCPFGGTSPLASEITGVLRPSPAGSEPGDHLVEARATGRRGRRRSARASARRRRLDPQLATAAGTPGRYDAVLAVGLRGARPAPAVRACRVVRKPPRASSTATAVPNEPGADDDGAP